MANPFMFLPCCRGTASKEEERGEEPIKAIVDDSSALAHTREAKVEQSPAPAKSEPPAPAPSPPASDEVLQFLGAVQLFKRLPVDQLPCLAEACVASDFEPGEVVITQGEIGSEFFVIKDGEAVVSVTNDGGATPIQVATLKAGEYFGEKALLRDEPRTATISAGTALKTYKITRAIFQELGLTEKLALVTRKAVGGGGNMAHHKTGGASNPRASKQIMVEKDPAALEKTEAEAALIADALRKNSNLTVMCPLSDNQSKALTAIAWKERVPSGKEIIKEGDLEANYFYIVQEGSFEILVKNKDAEGSAENAVGNLSSVGVVTRGGSFGELALLYLVPRAATVNAQVDSVVWVIDRDSFKSILLKSVEEKVTNILLELDKCALFEPLLVEEKKAVARAMQEMSFSKGDVVMQKDEQTSNVYILRKGDVEYQTGDNKAKVARSSPTSLRVFGERLLMGSETCDTTVKIRTDTADFLTIERQSFEMLVGPLSNILKMHKEEGTKRSPFSARRTAATSKANEKGAERKKTIRQEDLKRLGLLGCGGFGTVELVAHSKTGDTFAMKGLSKGHIVQTGMQEGVILEKNILLMLDSKFVIKLYETYNSPQMLYFLMEPAMGGELYATYMRKGLHGQEPLCKFYAAGVVLAFEHIHQKKILYRDLKPENILLTSDGRFKLTDMGLATVCAGSSYTTCGTPDYFAPEMITSAGHNEAVDWWTLGVLLFELMCGHPPFESETPMQTYTKVMKGISRVAFPVPCQGLVGDLVKALLKKEPAERLPMKPGKVKNIMSHKYYNGFDWEAMRNCTMDPPYKPQQVAKDDSANFSCNEEDCPPVIEYQDDGTGWDAEF
eukprot:TRINITY_DN8680_c0_g1_i1.p1 TRINITY_DN8680_c0_g1~~TRINITY_DN8680_c0_g1_i1.p1  ORF type:complete len:843 (+),score=242.01 TRINITY_DN8680_c0_g1_i1:120-2648(+)